MAKRQPRGSWLTRADFCKLTMPVAWGLAISDYLPLALPDGGHLIYSPGAGGSYLTCEESAAYIGCNASRLRQMAGKGHGEMAGINGGAGIGWLFHKDEVSRVAALDNTRGRKRAGTA